MNNKGNIMNIELNKVYEFDLTDKMSFGDISIDRLYDFFKMVGIFFYVRRTVNTLVYRLNTS